MKIASIITIKKELNHLTKEDLLELCLRMSKFKKENKALLTYLLFESHDEDGYITHVKLRLDELFESMNTNNYFYIKKTVRKILRQISIYSRFSLKKSTEIELLLYFCERLHTLKPSIYKNRTLSNLYQRQINTIKKKITVLHEDLQYDYNSQLELLTGNQ